MAGLGFKDFTVGEVLTSADVDGYLMQQTVMRFADSGARGSALGTAAGTGVALAEGMVSYLDDANYVQVFDGTKWRDPSIGIGSNVVQTVKTDVFTTTSTSYTTVTGLSASITPSSSSSLVLVLLDVSFGVNDQYADIRLMRDATQIYLGDSAGNRTRTWVEAFRGNTSNGSYYFSTQRWPGIFLDNPATASSVTYSLETKRISGSGVVYVNRNATDTDAATRGRVASSITLIEVAA